MEVLVPTGPVAVKVTVYDPASGKKCDTTAAVLLVIEPSPKSQKRFVIVPVDRFVKVTVNGLRPLVGPPANAAAGTSAPVPIRGLVLFPALAVVKTTALLKFTVSDGLKRMTRFVELKPGKLNGVPDKRLNGPPVTEAVPLLR